MCILGISPDEFNPRVLYILKRKFDGQSGTTYHSHDFLSFIYIISGSCTYKIDDSLYQVKKGDLILCNPGVFHGKIIGVEEEVMEYHIGLNNICIEGLPKDHLIAKGACPVINLGKYEQDFFKCFSEIMLEQEKNEPGRELMLKALVMKLVVILLKSLYKGETAGNDKGFVFESYDRNLVVNAIVSFINENYMNDISLDKIARNMYLSPVYISRIFKEETGESPINYLIKVRLSKAREMLEKGRMPIKAVAKSVGYDDAYHFSKLFKKYYGSPPSRYRKQGWHS